MRVILKLVHRSEMDTSTVLNRPKLLLVLSMPKYGIIWIEFFSTRKLGPITYKEVIPGI